MTAHQNRDGFGNTKQQAARARRFAQVYGLGPAVSLAGAAIARLEALANFLRTQADAGDAACRRNIEAGHLELYLADIEHIRRSRELFDLVPATANE